MNRFVIKFPCLDRRAKVFRILPDDIANGILTVDRFCLVTFWLTYCIFLLIGIKMWFYSDILIWRHRLYMLVLFFCCVLVACIPLCIWISQLPIIRIAMFWKNIYGLLSATKRGNMINIAMSANASDVLYKYLQTPDQIRVNGQWTFPFHRIVARRNNRWANRFRSTVVVQNFARGVKWTRQ